METQEIYDGGGSAQGGASRGKRLAGQKAARALYAKYYRSVKRYIAERVGSDQEAEDMAQEVFLAIRKRKPKDPEAYIFRVARNLVNRYWHNELEKRKAAAIPDFGDYEAGGGGRRIQPVSTKQWKRILARGHILMSVKLREAVELRFIEGLSCQETARRIGCSKWALYKRLQRAKKLLKEPLTNKR